MLMTPQPTDLEKLITTVMAVQARERSSAFGAVKAEAERMLAELEIERDGVDRIDPAELAGFAAKLKIFLRALSTYPAKSDEWLDVFRAFKRHVEHYMDQLNCGAAKPEGHSRSLELDRLRGNPRLILKEPEL